MSNNPQLHRCNPDPCIDVLAPLRHADINDRAGLDGQPLRDKAAQTAKAHLEGHALHKQSKR